MKTNDSGRYKIVDGVISYSSTRYSSWDLPLAEVSVIGEYTNEDGPFIDDYFLVFVTRNNLQWFEGSFYGAERDDLMRELSRLLDSELSLKLSHSTVFASRILWPDYLCENELFTFKLMDAFHNHKVLAITTSDLNYSEQNGAVNSPSSR